MLPRDPDIGDGLLAQAKRSGSQIARFWQSDREIVVCGRSNEPDRECHLDVCHARAIPVVTRRGGGGTVLLAPGMLVLSMAGACGFPARPRLAFERINAWVQELLRDGGVVGLTARGTSDLCLGNRKVLGCSLSFSGGCLLYQGVLLVNTRIARIADVLRHPSREPEYRAAREHDEFLTTLTEQGFAGSVEDWIDRFQQRFEARAPLPLAATAPISAPHKTRQYKTRQYKTRQSVCRQQADLSRA